MFPPRSSATPALHPALALALAAALAPALAGASDCKLKYRVNGISGALTGTLGASQSRTLNRNGLIEALNDGCDDLMLALENLGARGWCFQTPLFLPRGTPNAASDALESVFEGG